jgi:hypothetical protein
VALTLSLVAAYYSVLGLTAIFAAAVLPVVVMGGALEVGKVTATVWLHKNWSRSSFLYKAYLIPAVLFLMLLTSMGIFGFLSKAHSDQSLVSGDVTSKIAIYDEKIKISKDNIDANRKALKQMDEAVDQVMGRSTDEKGADKAVAIRRAQQKERSRLLSEISAEQSTISKLNEERAPIAAEVRKVEAEVGPIKYIAALTYGDNPDADLLERAVRWVIILIVVVFDPLALVLILAGSRHLEWAKEDKEQEKINAFFDQAKEAARRADEQVAVQDEQGESAVPEVPPAPPGNDFDISKYPYLNVPFAHFQDLPPMVHKPEVPSDPELDPCYKCGTTLMMAPGIGPFCPNKECDVIDGPFLNEEPIEITYISPTPVTDKQEYDYESVDEEWTDEDVYRISEETLQAIEDEEAKERELQEFFANGKEIARRLDAEESLEGLPNVTVVEEPVPAYEPDDGPLTDEQVEQLKKSVEAFLPTGPVVVASALFPEVIAPVNYNTEAAAPRKAKTVMLPEAAEPPPKIKTDVVETFDPKGKEITANSQLTADNDQAVPREVKAHFGTSFPPAPERSELYLRVDYKPNRLFKYNGSKWIEVEKELTDTYVYNQEYIKYLVEEIEGGRYDPDDLSDTERQQIAEFLGNEYGNNTPGQS